MPKSATLILKNIVTGIKKENLPLGYYSYFKPALESLKMLLESFSYILKTIS